MASILPEDRSVWALEMISSPPSLPPTSFNDSRVISVISKALPSPALVAVALTPVVTAISIGLAVVITKRVLEVLAPSMILMLLG